MNLDYVYKVNHFCRPGETISAGQMNVFCGGKGLNQSIAAAKSGAHVLHAGMIGKSGDMLLRFLRESNVDISLCREVSTDQGHAIIQVIPEGQNCIIVYGGTNREISCDYIDYVFSCAKKGSFLMLQNEVSNVGYAIEHAKAAGLKAVLNVSPITEDILSADFGSLDWLVVNEIECMAIANAEDPYAAYNSLKRKYPNTGILMTMGTNGSVCCKDGIEIKQCAYPVSAVDTTAAGDTFVGCFIGCLAQGSALEEAMEYAAMASAISVTRNGAAPSIPERDEVCLCLKRVKSGK